MVTKQNVGRLNVGGRNVGGDNVGWRKRRGEIMSWRKRRGKNVGGLNVGCDQIFMINLFFKIFFFSKIVIFMGILRLKFSNVG